MQGRTVLGKSRWVKHDKVIIVVMTVKIIESISAKSLVPIVMGEVNAYI